MAIQRLGFGVVVCELHTGRTLFPESSSFRDLQLHSIPSLGSNLDKPRGYTGMGFFGRFLPDTSWPELSLRLRRRARSLGDNARDLMRLA